MAAAAFKGILVLQTSDGPTHIPFTCTDVANAYAIFPSGSSDLQISGTGVALIRDILLSASGTDTSKMDVFINDRTIGMQLLNSANVGTVYNRQLQNAPLPIRAGARLRLQQLT
jgi:hypothetical protein